MRMNLYNTNFEAASLIFLLVAYVFQIKKYYNKSIINIGLKRLTLAQIITTILDLATSVTITYADVLPLSVNMIMNTLYFAMIAFTAGMIDVYVFAFSSRSDEHRKVLGLIRVLFAAFCVALAVNVPTGIVFAFDKGIYSHGPLYMLCYVLPAVALLVALITVMILKKSIKQQDFYALIAVIILAAVGPALQATLFPDILLSNSTPGMAILMGVMTLVSPNYQELVEREEELAKFSASLEEQVKIETAKVLEGEKKEQELSGQIVDALATAIDLVTVEKTDHAARVAAVSEEIAKRMNLPEEKVKNIYYMAVVHDIGSIGVPEEVLEKRGVYTPEERKLMQEHTNIGYKILQQITEISDIGIAAKWHHERYDGKGYPDGLAGDDIPIEARIVCLADSLDAMVSERTYKESISLDEAKEEIKKCSGSQFDPEIADCVIRLIEEKSDKLAIFA